MKKCSLLFLISFSFFLYFFANSVFAAPIASRTINFVNQCDFPVWLGFAGGSADNKYSKADRQCNSDADCFVGSVCGGNHKCAWNYRTKCASDNDCFPGSSCVTTGDFKQCFWINPTPSDGNHQLAAKGGANSVSIPVYDVANGGLIWSGAVAGRTGCVNSLCDTASCGGTANGACTPSRGFDQPATQAEFTFNRFSNGLDFYDVEVINGISIPVQMSPNTTESDPNNPYYCKSPGSPDKQTMLGECSWTFTPPGQNNDYQWVKAGGATCHLNSDCHNEQTCGLSFNPGKSPLLQKTCGKLLGYWTANQICAYNPHQGAPFNCDAMNDLYGCKGASSASCYQDGAKSTCCGCANWDTLGVLVPPSPYTKMCTNTNPVWNANVQPHLLWIKQGCPTLYTYPYDDMSSTFICRKVENNLNSLNYTITFCPGGHR